MLQLIRFAPVPGNARKKTSLRCEIYTWTLILMAGPSSLRYSTQTEFRSRRRSSLHRPANIQVLWRVKGFDFVRQESTLKLLALAFGGDPACTDCNRVQRVPGFLNLKCDPPTALQSNIRTTTLRMPMTSGSTFRPRTLCCPSLISCREDIRASRVIRKSIGLGLCMNLPAEKIP
jgi:RepB DNA-primase from phage plasmid